jgi:hypothetical protein
MYTNPKGRRREGLGRRIEKYEKKKKNAVKLERQCAGLLG